MIMLEQYESILVETETDTAEAKEHLRELETLVRFLRRKVAKLTGPDQPVLSGIKPNRDYSPMSLLNANGDE